MSEPKKRITVPADIRRAVFIEAGFRCAVPTCRGIGVLDLHHIVEVAEGGPTDVANLIALCPTCHALYTRGKIPREAIQAYKIMLVALSQAFDQASINNLLFLALASAEQLRVSGDGVLHFTHLIAAGLADYALFIQNGPLLLYQVALTPKGAQVVTAWRSGDRAQIEAALAG